MGYDEANACRCVSDEFPESCTCSCDDDEKNTAKVLLRRCLLSRAPTTEPPTTSPTEEPTVNNNVPIMWMQAMYRICLEYHIVAVDDIVIHLAVAIVSIGLKQVWDI